MGIDGGATCLMMGGEITGNIPASPQVIRFGNFMMTGGIVIPPCDFLDFLPADLENFITDRWILFI